MEPNQLSKQSQGQLKTTIRAEMVPAQLNNSLHFSNQEEMQERFRDSMDYDQVPNPFHSQQ